MRSKTKQTKQNTNTSLICQLELLGCGHQRPTPAEVSEKSVYWKVGVELIG